MLNIFDYTSASKFFVEVLEHKKAKNPMFSLRSAAAQIGTSPSTLSFFIHDKKNYLLKLVEKFVIGLSSHQMKKNIF